MIIVVLVSNVVLKQIIKQNIDNVVLPEDLNNALLQIAKATLKC